MQKKKQIRGGKFPLIHQEVPGHNARPALNPATYYSEQYGAPAIYSLNKLFKLNRTCKANQKCSPWALGNVTKYWRWFVCVTSTGLEKEVQFSPNLWRNIFFSFLVHTLAEAEHSPSNAVLPILLSNPPGPPWSLPEQSALPPCFKIVTYVPCPSPFWRPASVFIFFDTTPGFNSLIPAVALEVFRCTQCPPSSPSSCLWFYS